MSDRTNVSVPDAAFEHLKEHKRAGESWGDVFHRAAEALHGTESPDGEPDATHIPDGVLTEAHIDDIVNQTAAKTAREIKESLR